MSEARKIRDENNIQTQIAKKKAIEEENAIINETLWDTAIGTGLGLAVIVGGVFFVASGPIGWFVMGLGGAISLGSAIKGAIEISLANAELEKLEGPKKEPDFAKLRKEMPTVYPASDLPDTFEPIKKQEKEGTLEQKKNEENANSDMDKAILRTGAFSLIGLGVAIGGLFLIASGPVGWALFGIGLVLAVTSSVLGVLEISSISATIDEIKKSIADEPSSPREGITPSKIQQPIQVQEQINEKSDIPDVKPESKIAPTTKIL